MKSQELKDDQKRDQNLEDEQENESSVSRAHWFDTLFGEGEYVKDKQKNKN